MDLRAFSVCRGCYEVYPSARFCPHCAADGLAQPAPAPAPAADTAVADDLIADAPPTRAGTAWLAGVAVAGLAVAVILAASSV